MITRNYFIKAGLDVYQACESHRILNNVILVKYGVDFDSRPKKPMMPHSKSSSGTFIEYGELLKAYEESKAGFDKKRERIGKILSQLDVALKDYIKYEAGLYDIPKIAQEKVWSKAWADGHSAGHHEVYQELDELVDLFKDIK